jgi:hypothetical protein
VTSIRLRTTLAVAEGKMFAFHCDGMCRVTMGSLSLEIGADEMLTKEENVLVMKQKVTVLLYVKCKLKFEENII